jgi:uncharacterized repeat protein (TIGR01451 family)
MTYKAMPRLAKLLLVLGVLLTFTPLMFTRVRAADESGGNQQSPVAVKRESYIVTTVTGENGNKQEKLTKSKAAQPGQVIEYHLLVSNQGPTTLPANTVTVTGPVPSGATYVADSATSSKDVSTEFSADNGKTFSKAPGGSGGAAPPVQYNAVRWTLLTPLEPGQEKTLVYRVRVVAPPTVSLESYIVSTVTGDNGNKQEKLTKATTALPGQVVEYRLLVSNNNPVPLQAGTVVITGPIPDGTTYVANSATPSSKEVLTEFSADGGKTFSRPPVLVAAGSGGERKVAQPKAYDAVRWTLLAPLKPKQQRTFVYRVTVNQAH